MKSLNKTLSLVLVLVMVLGMFGIAGASFNDQAEIENEEAVNTMVALNIINGKNGNVFDPTGNVTRAEMAKMICVALNGGKEPVLSTSATPLFTDIGGHWGQKYIEYCANIGIVAGMGDGTFAPDASVTGSQAAKMMLVAMGYNAKVFGFEGASWELTTNVEANKVGLYNELNVNASDAINRDNAAQLIFNGVFSGLMIRTWSQDKETGKVSEHYNFNTEKSIATEKYGLSVQIATLGEVDYNDVKKEYTYDFGAAANIDLVIGSDKITEITSTDDYTQLYGMKVKVLWTVDKKGDTTLFDMFSVDTTVMLMGVVGQLSDATMNANDIVFGGKTYKFDGAVAATRVYDFNNGLRVQEAGKLDTSYLGNYYVAASGTGLNFPAQAALFQPELASYIFKALDTNGNNKIDRIVVYPYTVEEVTYVGATTATIGGVSYDLADVVSYEGMAVGDYVKFTAAANTATGINTFEKITPIEGKVEAKTATKTTIGGIAMGDLVGLTLGATYENIAIVNGFIHEATLKVDAVSAEKFAVVLGAGKSNYGDDIANLLMSDGTKKEVDVASPATAFAPTSSTIGTLVTYTVDSKDVYTLTAVDTAAMTAAKLKELGFSSFDSNSDSGLKKESFNYDKGTLGGNKVDDGAVVFAKTSSGYKVLSGKEFKSAHSMKQSVGTCLFTKHNKTTGFDSVILAYVDISSSAIGAVEYGYVTDNVASVKNDKGNDVSRITFWNGTEDVTLTATKNYKDLSVVTRALAKGDLFRYTLDNDGLMTIIDENSGGKVDFFSPNQAQVSARQGNSVQFTDGVNAPIVGNITEDTVIFNIDSKAQKGVLGNSIIKSNGTDNNAAYLLIDNSVNKDVAFVVVDTLGKLQGIEADSFTLYNSNNLAGAYAKADHVIVAGDYSGTITNTASQSLHIAGDLNITGTTTAYNVSVAGDLLVNGAADANLTATHFKVTGTTTINTLGDVSFNSELNGDVFVEAAKSATFKNVEFGGNVVIGDAIASSAVIFDGETTVAGTVSGGSKIAFGDTASAELKAAVAGDANQEAVNAEVGKYKTPVVIASTVNVETVVTLTVAERKDDAGALGDGITLSYAVKTGAEYLTAADSNVTLKAQKTSSGDATATVTITFTKGGKTATQDVVVTIQSKADADSVAAAKASITGDAMKNVNVAKAGEEATAEEKLAAVVAHAAAIEAVADEGVTITAKLKEDLTYTFTITKGSATDTKDVAVTFGD